ncbi:NAD(P)/FAD-dependent oxidoreductase [Falsiroseomonas ponticola]|jgi:predicted NAD/FAD-dependent oxidoreductase|uniref:NAD(P)/FAD-dependent oxidoreductase n=1 Tax=Falsiroseomonas ponticola TaxID=2786951 RepID=UPI001933F046|nr:NAD(P)-binding protein [Roseomonas ponticola]
MVPQNIAIVGAGLAGMACAKTLEAHGARVRLFEKSRRPGGRMATRRVEVEGVNHSFDHGAQYLTAKGAHFAAVLDATRAQTWPDVTRRVGQPNMASICRGLADGLDIVVNRHVVEIAGRPGAWTLRHHDAALITPGAPAPDVPPQEDGPFDAVALAIPAPQAVPLLAGPAPHLAHVLEGVVMAPCWTLMIAFPTRLPLPDTLRLTGGPIGWAARDSSKPGRNAEQENWVVQAGPAWSREHLERRPVVVAKMLRDALEKLVGQPLPPPLICLAHRWRYALVETPLGAPCLWDPATGLGAGGDWAIAARAEAAVDSGAALAAAIRRQ